MTLKERFDEAAEALKAAVEVSKQESENQDYEEISHDNTGDSNRDWG